MTVFSVRQTQELVLLLRTAARKEILPRFRRLAPAPCATRPARSTWSPRRTRPRSG